MWQSWKRRYSRSCTRAGIDFKKKKKMWKKCRYWGNKRIFLREIAVFRHISRNTNRINRCPFHIPFCYYPVICFFNRHPPMAMFTDPLLDAIKMITSVSQSRWLGISCNQVWHQEQTNRCRKYAQHRNTFIRIGANTFLFCYFPSNAIIRGKTLADRALLLYLAIIPWVRVLLSHLTN